MTVIDQLSVLESSGLIRLAQAQPDLEYLFRHALVQDAAYASLLREDRRRLHQAVGAMLERLYPDRLSELAPVLGNHFGEAGDHAKALHYFTLAGEQAMQRYAAPEAVMHYTRALEFATKAGSPARSVLRARGQAHELLGNFDQAHADYEGGLEESHRHGDLHDEWQVLLDLGFLWAGRDYRRTGEYYQRAYELAQQMGDPEVLARSLNRIGNWKLNSGRLQEAIGLHQRALGLFEVGGDRRGIAETLDLLGMSSALNGDMDGAADYYRRAIPLFEELRDYRGMSSSYAAIATRSANYMASNMVTQATLAESVRDAERAVGYAREIHWRAGESFAQIMLGIVLSSQGEYAQGLQAIENGFHIAEAIQHHQWLANARCFWGVAHLDLFALGPARRHLEEALRLAGVLNSQYWMDVCSACLAAVCVAERDFARAEDLLSGVARIGTPAQMLSQRHVWATRGELALARGDAAEAVRGADMLDAALFDGPRRHATLRVEMLRGNALLAMGRPAEAEAALAAARDVAAWQGARPLLWRCLASLGRAYRAQGRVAEADRAASGAYATVDQLVANVPTDELRIGFVTGAAEYIGRAG
jgi:tetratricopeptide (TPR) repeat protein